MEAKIKENYFPPKIMIVGTLLQDVLCSSITMMEDNTIESFFEDEALDW